MEIQVFKLDDNNVKDYYVATINNEDCYSITFTLHPSLNNADILTQYRKAIKEIKDSKIFYYKDKKTKLFEIHPEFEEMIIVPELTKQLNIHFHGYFKCNPKFAQYFQNEFRKLCFHSTVLGRQHTFKNIDNMTDELRFYPFKEISQLTKFPDWSKIYIYKFNKNNIDF